MITVKITTAEGFLSFKIMIIYHKYSADLGIKYLALLTKLFHIVYYIPLDQNDI